MNSKKNRLVLTQQLALGALALLLLSYVAQVRYDTWSFYNSPTVSVSYNNYIEPEPLSGAAAKAASFGATEFVADWYWLELIQYYGGGDPTGQYRQLPALYNTITDLAPKFSAVYQNGLLVLPSENFVSQAIALGQKGQKNLPTTWQIPYDEGLVYYIYKKDYTAAAAQFTIAAQDPGTPAIVKYFVGLFYNASNNYQKAYAVFQTVYQTTTDSFVKDRAKKYLDHLDGLFALQNAVTKYNQTYGHNPASLNDLITGKIVSAVPVSPLGINYTYNAVTGQVGDNATP